MSRILGYETGPPFELEIGDCHFRRRGGLYPEFSFETLTNIPKIMGRMAVVNGARGQCCTFLPKLLILRVSAKEFTSPNSPVSLLRVRIFAYVFPVGEPVRLIQAHI